MSPWDELHAGEHIRMLEEQLAQLTKERDALRVCFAEASHNAGPAFVAHEELAAARTLLEDIFVPKTWEEHAQLLSRLATLMEKDEQNPLIEVFAVIIEDFEKKNLPPPLGEMK